MFHDGIAAGTYTWTYNQTQNESVEGDNVDGGCIVEGAGGVKKLAICNSFGVPDWILNLKNDGLLRLSLRPLWHWHYSYQSWCYRQNNPHLPVGCGCQAILGNNEFRGIFHSCCAVADICNVVLPGRDFMSEDLVMAPSFMGKGFNTSKHIDPLN
jgi:hypothetical protein